MRLTILVLVLCCMAGLVRAAEEYHHTFAYDPGLKIPSGFFPERGYWRIQPYKHITSLQHVLGQVSGTAEKPLILLNRPLENVQSMSVKMTIENGSTSVAGLVLDSSAGRILKLALNISENTMQFIAVHKRDGHTTERVLNSQPIRLRHGKWYKLACAQREDGVLVGTLDGQRELLLRPLPRRQWRLGFFTDTGTSAYFEDFRYTYGVE